MVDLNPICSATAALDKASRNYCEARAGATRAIAYEETALMALNEAQAAFDAVIKGIRDGAPDHSAWRDDRPPLPSIRA